MLVYIGLGSNQGDRLANLEYACSAMPPEVNVIVSSPVYETPPWGYLDQPAFLNQVVEAESKLEPHELLRHLKLIEVNLGRKETFKYGPRIIDLDILFYGEVVYKTENLTIPHPQIEQRAFILVPLSDLAPDLVHPVSHKTISQLLAEVDQTGITLFDRTA